MIKVLAKLPHDLKARAGQLLVEHESGDIYAVDPQVLEDAVVGVVRSYKREARDDRAARISHMHDLLLRGFTTSQVADETGIPRGTVCNHRARMSRDGLLPYGKTAAREADPAPPAQPKKHNWFKSAEALEGARARGRALAAARNQTRKAAEA